MKKPICKKGVECVVWKKDLYHSVLYMHGPGDASKDSEDTEGPSAKAAGPPPAKKRMVEPPSDTDNIKSFLEENYLVSFPVDFFRFWKTLQYFQKPKDDICCAFKALKGLRLVGPFEVLAEQSKKKDVKHDEDYYLTAHRFATDLPELQTLAVYEGGRYAYWRDTPDSKDAFLVHVKHDDGHFPKMEIIGDGDPRWIIVNLIGSKASKVLSAEDGKLWPSLYKIYDQEVKRLVRERKKNSYGQPFHGLGLYVEVTEDDVGFRPLENPPPAKLKALLKKIAGAAAQEEKEKLKEELMDVTTYVDIANDEMDYSLGLEVGHDLFWSNYADFDRFADITLSNSYSLLKRDAFSTILKAHMKVRRTNSDLDH